jgi:O-antigen ligase
MAWSMRVSRRSHPSSRIRVQLGDVATRNTDARVCGWIAAALAVGIPLALDPGGYFIFLPIKWTLATVLVAAGMGAMILQRRPLARSAPVAAWGALLLVILAASIFGVGGLTSWIGYPGRYLGVIAWITFFGAFALGASLRDPRDRARVVNAAAAGSILVSAYALLQAAGVDFIQWAQNVDVSRTRSTLGSATFLGAYLAMIVPIAGRLALSRSEPVRIRAIHTGAAVLGSIALLTTQTRAAWLGAVAGILLVLVLELPRLRANPARSAAVVGVGLVVVLLFATVSPAASRIRSIVDPSLGTGRGRLLQWDRTLHLIAARPVLGWGPEAYAFVFPRFIDPGFERIVGRDVIPDRAHNVFLDLASNTGVLGVVAFLVILGLVARGVIRARERDAVTVALAGGCTAYLVQLQFSFPVADLDTVFWLFAGLMIASTVRKSRTVSRGWAVVPLVAALLLTVWGSMDVAADRALREALNAEAAGRFRDAQHSVDRAAELAPGRVQYLQAAERLNRRVGEASGHAADFARGLDSLDQAQHLVPQDPELALDRGDLLLSWGEAAKDSDLIERAVSQYGRILRLDPASSRVHLKLGVAYVELGRRHDAEREWLTAASLSPRSSGPLVNLGLLYELEGRKDEARRSLREALALDPTNSVARAALERVEP